MESSTVFFALLLLIPASRQQDSFSNVPVADRTPVNPQYYLVESGTSNSVCLVLSSAGVIQLRNASEDGSYSSSAHGSQLELTQITQPCQPSMQGRCVQLLIEIVNNIIITETGSFSVRHTSSEGTITDVNVRFGPIDLIQYVGEMTLDTPIPIMGGNDEIPFEVYLSGTPLSNSPIVCEENSSFSFVESTVLSAGSFMRIMSCIPAVGGGSFTQPYSLTVGFFMNMAVYFSPRRIKVKLGGSCDDNEGISSPELVMEGFVDSTTTPEITTFEITTFEITNEIITSDSSTSNTNVALSVGVSVAVVAVLLVVASVILVVACIFWRRKHALGTLVAYNVNEEDGLEEDGLGRIGVVSIPNRHDSWCLGFGNAIAEKKNAQFTEDIDKIENLTLYLLIQSATDQSHDTASSSLRDIQQEKIHENESHDTASSSLRDIQQEKIHENAANNTEVSDSELIKPYNLPRHRIVVVHLDSDKDEIEKTVPYTSLSLSSESSRSPTSAASQVIALQSQRTSSSQENPRASTEPTKRKVKQKYIKTEDMSRSLPSKPSKEGPDNEHIILQKLDKIESLIIDRTDMIQEKMDNHIIPDGSTSTQ